MFNDLIGKNYQKNGCGPDGYDCYNLCLEVCKRLKINLPGLENLIEHDFKKVKKPNAGDLVYIKNVDERHVGVMIDSRSFLQVTSGHTVHQMRINHPWVKNRITGFYRYVA